MLYKVAAVILYPFIMLLFRIKVIGLKKIPRGAAVICANHTSLWDPVLLGITLTAKNPLCYMAKKELFENPFLGFLLRHLGVFPVERESADLATIRKSIEVLKADKKVAIFPEGRRVREGDVAPNEVKTGVAMIAMRAGVPIVPIFLSGNKRMLRRTWVCVGDPIMPEMQGESKSDNYKRIATEAFNAIIKMGEGK